MWWRSLDAGVSGRLSRNETIVLEGALCQANCTWVRYQSRKYAFTYLSATDISYTKMPTWIKLIHQFEHDQHASFSSLAPFGFPESRAEYGIDPSASPIKHVKLPPDEHMLCYDYLYYV